MTNARKLVWIGIAAVAAVVLAVALWPGGGDTSVAARTRSITSDLRCVDCEGLSVADSATASARATRKDVAARVRRGESAAEIRQVYVDRDGESILLKPAGNGVGLLVWALPVIAVILGAGGLLLAIRRWQRQPRLAATAEDEAIVAAYRAEHADPTDGGAGGG
ncbi:MAG: cytochrome c-type biogenesis protein [Acidimicrobiia bacterium]